ncbi:MAG: SusC/RagA family TonB-linked outer membrane protein [Candidatus Cryptobacteroides sp.]
MKKSISLLLIGITLCPMWLLAQNTGLQGTVYDPSGDGLPGASVFLKGNNKVGTVTDVNGNFTINAKAGDILVASFIGFKDVEAIVTGTERITIRFDDSSIILDETIVVGYGVQKKSVMSSSVSKITGDDLDLGNPTTVQNALQGKLSGVSIISNSGQPGSDATVRIRGVGTVHDSNPLYIVDGMPSESGINHLNPSDIESIEVLKDAASAAIYGSRGANGVILVTTKKGDSSEKARVAYEFTYGIQNPANMVELCNSKEYQTLMNEMAANSGKELFFSTPSSVNTNWKKELQNKNASIMNHKVSVSGGNRNSDYYLSFGYVDQEGVLAPDHSDYTRYNVRLKYNTTLLNTDSRNWLNRITIGTAANYSKSIFNGSTINNSEASGLITSINALPPTEPVYQTDPSILAQYEVMYPNRVIAPNGMTYNIIDMPGITNPLADLQVNHNEKRTPQNFGANFNLDVDIIPGLRFRTTYGAEWMFSDTRDVTPVYELNASNRNTSSKVYNQKSQYNHWQWENTLSFNRNFGKNGIGAVIGTSMSSYHNSYIGANDYDLLVVDIDKGYIDTATASEDNSQVWGSAGDHKMASLFARVNYNYDEKYLFEAVVRRDGSSNFSKSRRYSVFPSVSAGWVITKEPWMKSVRKVLNFGKIRFSWGQNGNERIGSFAYTSMMSQGHNAVVDGTVYTGMLPSGYANADLKWETSEQIDLGLDLRFFDNALTFTFDYYKKNTKDMLMNMPIPRYTSYSSMMVNAGTVENTGVELEASYRLSIGDFDFAVGANATWLKNVVTNQGPDRTGLNNIGGGMGGTVTYAENGRPYGFFYGYVHDGIFQNWDEINSYSYIDGEGNKKLKQPDAKPGDIRFKDLDGENGINADDRTMIGSPIPDWTFGINLYFAYKGLDLSAFFQGTQGNDIFKLYRRSNLGYANWEKSWMNRWHGDGTSNWVPRVVEGDNNNYRISSFFVEDGSYLRLKVLQIGYSLPKKWMEKIHVRNLRFFLQGENLFTLTNYSGNDPEVGTRNGFDGGTYPQARTFTVGASITF